MYLFLFQIILNPSHLLLFILVNVNWLLSFKSQTPKYRFLTMINLSLSSESFAPPFNKEIEVSIEVIARER